MNTDQTPQAEAQRSRRASGWVGKPVSGNGTGQSAPTHPLTHSPAHPLTLCLLPALLFLLGAAPAARASSLILEGQNQGNTNTWSAGNLQGWLELDYIPCRVRLTGGPLASQALTISFPHLTGTTPGFENFYNFTASSNVVFISAPELFSPDNGDWAYRFTVQITDSNPATIQFFARMAAGAHRNPGSSLQLSGNPPSMGNLQIHKPDPGPGAPDLAIKKTGPTTVPLGGIIVYNLSYTNQAATNTAVGAQISDLLPPGVNVLTNTLGDNAQVAGNTIFWDLTNVAPRAAGSFSFKAEVNATLPIGSVLTNFSQILSSENDANYADNISTWRTTVGPPGCSLFNGGAGNTSQGGINFELALAHVGDTVQVFPSLGMVSNACSAVNVTGAVYVATGLLTNFLENVSLAPDELVSCPGHALCTPGPYVLVITPGLVGAPVSTPLGTVPGLPKQVRAVENGFGTVLSGDANDHLADFHSASIQVVTPCLRVFETCDPLPGQSCLPVGALARFRGSVTNCGDITLTNVTVVDDRVGQLQLFNPTNGLPLTNNVILTPGDYAVFSNRFLPTLQETCAGSAANGVTATGTDITRIGGPRASVTHSATAACAICVHPGIAVTKTCPPGPVAPGSPLVFNGSVTNTGDLTLTNVIIVNDRPLTSGSTLVATFTSLIPGESRNFKGSYFVPTNQCSVTDTLTASAATLCGVAGVTNTASATCAVTNTPGLMLTLNCPSPAPAPGQLFMFTGTVTNIGDVAVTNLVMVSSQPANNTPVTVVARLEPGRGTNYSGSYLVPANACSLTGTVTATGFDVCGTAVTTQVTRTCAVTDLQKPVVTCSSNLVLAADAGRCSRSNVTFTVSATDPCGVTNLVSSPASGSTFPVGTTPVMTTATDSSGNQSSCTFTVTVTDTQNPAITCPSNLVFTANPGQCDRSNVTFTVSATDNCSVTNLVSHPPPGSAFPVGVTTVTSTATDASGNQSTCTFTVTVTDNQNPVIVCPSNLVLTADAGQCSRSNVTFAFNASDNCGVKTKTSSPPSGSTFPMGVTTVTNTATDAAGNQSTCTFTVTVTDSQSPVLSCSTNLVLTADPGRCSRSNVTFSVSATDNCAVTNLVSTPPSGSIFPVGVTTVTNTARDASGNQSSCTFTVTVTDTQNPVITCPSNVVLTADAGRCSRSNVTFAVTAADNCTVTNVVSSPASGSTFPVGNTAVTSTATDASGNQTTCTFSVIVTDDQPPTIACPPTVMVNASAGLCAATNVVLGVSVTSDNCGVDLVINNAPASFPVGTNLVTWAVRDTSGNTASCVQTVVVKDAQPPIITCPTVVTVNVAAGLCVATNVNLGVPVASDNCGVVSLTNNAPANFPVGTTSVTWTARDASGNFATCIQTVFVNDAQPPMITCPPAVTVNASPGLCAATNVNLGVPMTGDNCSVTNVTNNAPASFPVGTNSVTWTVRDASGNTAICVQTVVVKDAQPPIITCPTVVTVNVAAGLCVATNVNLGMPVTSDNCGVVSLTNNAPANFPVGATSVTWTARDASGNFATCIQTVFVNDAQPPTITCPPAVDVNASPGLCAATNVILGVPVTGDNCSVTNVTNNAPASFPVGTNSVTWTVRDASGNTATCVQTVIVTDAQPPTIICPADLTVNPSAGLCIATNVNLGVPATSDNCGVASVTNNAPASFVAGTNLIIWTARDANGNIAMCVQTVIVRDAQPPTITCPSNVVVNASIGLCAATNVNLGVPATSDNCGVASVTNDAPASFPVGTNSVTWTVSDGNGNTAMCTQTVIVRDAQPPTITCPATVTVNASAGLCAATNVGLGALVASDNCGVTSVTNDAPASFPVGTNTVTWTVRDASSNTATCAQTVIVRDAQSPTISCPENLVLTTDAGRCSRSNVTFRVTAADNCSVTNLVSNPASGSTFPLGTTTVTNSATDASGNTSTCTFTVKVTDNESPVFITCPPNLTVEAGEEWAFGVAAASDNCGPPTLSVTTATNLGCGTTLTATRTWRATDGSGNFTECSQTVTVADTAPPTVSITSPADGSRYGTPATFTFSASAFSFAGPITTLEFFSGTNRVSVATNAQYVAGLYTNSVTLSNVTVGTYVLTARATDPCGLTGTSSLPVTVIVEPPIPPGFEVGPMVFNPQNGLWQQLIKMTNLGLATIVSVQAFFSDLQPAGVAVYNATGTNEGVPYLLYNQPIPAGGTAIMVVQYYTAGHVAPSSSVRFVLLSEPPPPPDVSAGVPVPISKARFLTRSVFEGYFLIDFPTREHAVYYVQYATDLPGGLPAGPAGTNTGWTTSLIRVFGNGTTLRWLDYGPTATASLPKEQPRRFYRVLELPNP